MRPRTLQISFFVLLFTVCASWRAHADIIIEPTTTNQTVGTGFFSTSRLPPPWVARGITLRLAGWLLGTRHLPTDNSISRLRRSLRHTS